MWVLKEISRCKAAGLRDGHRFSQVQFFKPQGTWWWILFFSGQIPTLWLDPIFYTHDISTCMVKSEILFLNPPFDPISSHHGTRTRYHIFHGRDRPWCPPCSAVRSGGDRWKSCGPSPCCQGGGQVSWGEPRRGARYPNFWGLLPWQYPWIRGHFGGTHFFLRF